MKTQETSVTIHELSLTRSFRKQQYSEVALLRSIGDVEVITPQAQLRDTVPILGCTLLSPDELLCRLL